MDYYQIFLCLTILCSIYVFINISHRLSKLAFHLIASLTQKYNIHVKLAKLEVKCTELEAQYTKMINCNKEFDADIENMLENAVKTIEGLEEVIRLQNIMIKMQQGSG